MVFAKEAPFMTFQKPFAQLSNIVQQLIHSTNSIPIFGMQVSSKDLELKQDSSDGLSQSQTNVWTM